MLRGVSGDSSVTLSASDYPTQLFNMPLSTPRDVTLPPSGQAVEGMRFRIVRGTNASSFHTLNVKDGLTTLRSVSGVPQWADFECTGSMWLNTATGML